MSKNRVNPIMDNINPIKEYRAIDNFNIEGFYNFEKSFATSKNFIKEDIDIPLDRLSQNFNHKEYSQKIIREYTPWENYINNKIKAIDFSHSSDESRLDTKVKTLNTDKKEKSKGINGWIAAIIGIIILKFSAIFKILLAITYSLFKSTGILVYFESALIPLGSMILSIIFYASAYNISYAIGLVFLLFMHEMGHAIMIALNGYSAGLPVFIPFFGAAIHMKQMPKDAFTEAIIALGGPILGTLSSMSLLGGYYLTDNLFFLTMAYTVFMLNLINLTPVSPLDGGKIVSAISKLIWIPAIIVLLGITLVFKTPVLVLILIFATLNLFSSNKNKNTDYYNVPLNHKLFLAAGYFALVIFLAIASYESFKLMPAIPFQ